MNLSRHAELIRQIFDRFYRAGRKIFTGVRWLASQIKASERTVKRALAELRNAKLITSTRRYRRSSVHEMADDRQMRFDFGAEVEQPCPHNGPTIINLESKSLVEDISKLQQREIHTKRGRVFQLPNPSSRSKVTPLNLLVGYDEGFVRFMELYRDSGKPLNDFDRDEAWDVWQRLSIDDRLGAIRGIILLIRKTSDVNYIPEPANFLRKKSWTRVAAERKIAYEPDKPEKDRSGESEARRSFENMRRHLNGKRSA